MASGAKIGHKRKTRNNILLEKNGSDESDEDYIYRGDEDEELNHSEDDYFSALAEDESEESLGEFDDDEDTNVKPRKEKITNSKEEDGDEEEYDAFCLSGVRERKKSEDSRKEDDDKAPLQEDEDDLVVENPRKKPRVSRTETNGDSYNEDPKEKDNVSCSEEKEGADNDMSDGSEHEEFTPGEVSQTTTLKPVERRVSRTENSSNLSGQFKFEDTFSLVRRIREGVQEWKQARSEKPAVVVNHDSDSDSDFCRMFEDSDDEELTPGEVLISIGQKLVGRQVSRTKNKSSGKLKSEDSFSLRRRIREGVQEWKRARSKKPAVTVNHDSDSDSDYQALCNYSDGEESTSSDFKYTMSEEEREQVKEATAFCKNLKTSLRNSNSLKTNDEETEVALKGKRQGRKGKEKVVDLNIEIRKQVCRICLSEEGKETIRGVLNCCSHYFCFACIMEWSKVESRCPLCKQRFATISRTARMDGGHDFSDAVFPVPERDQVYQPSEEELRGYLDPHDIRQVSDGNNGAASSSAATNRFGSSIGRGVVATQNNINEAYVPETPLSQVNGQTRPPAPTASGSGAFTLHDRRRIQRVVHAFLNIRSRQSGGSDWLASSSAATNLFGSPTGRGAVATQNNINEAYVPETPSSQVNGQFRPPAPTASGSGAFTLQDRRRIQRVIHAFLNIRSRQSGGSDGVASSSALTNLFGSPIGCGVVATQNNTMPRMMPPQNLFRGRLPDCNIPSLSPRLSNLRGNAFQSQASTSNGHTFGGLSQSNYARTGGGFVQQPQHPCSATSNPGAGAS